ncbi:hypothetical protein PRIPAC_70942 [Pristionchus pacificus]|uniref:Uncharacterized protein n=1 Tax=Pristionchus pacificus TaxID=54126 RepID=A0A2A6CEZ2_PRIPA|nr:hypothetical protein PRIPAC_70942 [Pristionchus pacificus]|eukprot:PDM76774.1 hypothetical protein PRIPAC_42169 [Pristionchus pacificus]
MSRTMSRRSRSRSRTPPVRAKPKKVVNMLDSTALSEAKEARRKPFHERVTGGPPRGPRFEAQEGAPRGPRIEAPDSGPRAQRVEAPEGGPERITCTIEGSGVRRSVFNRVSGGNFESRGRFDSGGGNRGFDGHNRSFDGGNRGFDGNRSFNSFNDRRVNIAGDGRRSFPDRRSFGDRAVQRDDDDWFRRRQQDGGEGGGEKPVMKLVDPQEVPRSNRFFTHDDRGGGDSEWRGRDMYDPRKDTGRYSDRPRFDRGDRRDRDYGNNNRDYGSRDFGGGRGDYGNNRRFDRSGDDRDSRRDSGAGGWDGFRQNGNGYSGSRFTPRNSGVDGVWAHDKYLELETEDDEKVVEVKDEAENGGGDDEGVLVIDSTKTERTVE